MRSSLRVLASTVVVVVVGVCVAGPALAYGVHGQPPVIALSTTVVSPGGSLTVQGQSFTPHGSVELTLHSAPVFLARLSADGDGAFSVQVTIPAATTPGSHMVEALDVATGDIATAAVTVTAVPIDLPPPPLAGTGVAVAALTGTGLVLLWFGLLLVASARRRSATRS